MEGKMNRVTEAHIQAVLMKWVMVEKNHNCFIPNSNEFFFWEADLISVTKSGLVHEFEVKLNIYDFRADAKKQKHAWIGQDYNSPAYFWYVTYDFEIEPPEKSGWILITQDDSPFGWKLEVKKEAPRLNNWKPDQRRTEQIARLLSWRLFHINQLHYLKKEAGSATLG